MDPAPIESPALQLSTTRRRLVVGALMVGTFLASLEIMIVAPAVPVMVGELGGAGLYPWIFSSYVIAQTGMTPVYGMLSDRWGRRPTYALSVVTFAIGSLICALAPSMKLLVLGRLFQGLGAGGLVPLTHTIFGDLYTVRDRARMQGALSLVWATSALIGPAVGGVLTEAFSWRAAFWINLPPAAIAAGAIALFLPALPLSARATEDPSSTGLWAGTRVLLGLPGPRNIAVSSIALGAVLIGFVGFLPAWIQAIEGGTPTDAGLAIIPLSLAWTAASIISGRLVPRLGFRTLVRIGTVITALGCGIAAVSPSARAGLVLVGLGMGTTLPSFNVAVQEGAPDHLRGQASSLSLLARSFGRAVGVVAFGWVAGIPAGAEDFAAVPGLEAGLGRVFVAIAGCATVAMMVVWSRFPRVLRPR